MLISIPNVPALDSIDLLYATYLGSLALMLLSAHFLRLQFSRHIALCAAPAALALLLLASAEQARLASVMASLILCLNLVAQKFSVRFLQGDQDQARAMWWMSVTSASASLCWWQADLRVFLLCWGIAIFGLVQLLGLARDWPAAQATRRHAARYLGASWVALCILILLNFAFSASWQIPSTQQVSHWPRYIQELAALLLVIAAIIPAAQWPFQRWLMNSLVAPTPVSAFMHAGLVNAGGVLLMLFSSVLQASSGASILLALLACASILLGNGMQLVQVDVKRQLACSTVAQMGCMLLQCAIGAYSAALMHLVLHGMFKAGLFLQAGSALQVPVEVKNTPTLPHALPLSLLLISLAGLALLMLPQANVVQIFSALLLALTCLQALLLMPAWRTVGYLLLLIPILWSMQLGFQSVLGNSLPAQGAVSHWLPVLGALIVLASGTAALHYLRQRPHLALSQAVYWRLVHASEASQQTMDIHPQHLQGRMQRHQTSHPAQGATS